MFNLLNLNFLLLNKHKIYFTILYSGYKTLPFSDINQYVFHLIKL